MTTPMSWTNFGVDPDPVLPAWGLVGEVGDMTMAFVDLGGAWIEITEIVGFWPVEQGSMVLTCPGIALPVTDTPEDIVEKLKAIALRGQQ